MLSKNRIKKIKSLQNKKSRDEENCFVLEGEKAVLEIVEKHSISLLELFYTSAFQLPETSQLTCVKTEVTEQELKQISGLQTPNKALAICKKMNTEPRAFSFALALDGIQDPGNLGTLIRLADWYGLKQLFCSLDTVECYNPKVVQATMGSLFRVEVHYVDLPDFLKTCAVPVYGALMEGKNIYAEQVTAHGVLVLGNEGKGISLPVQDVVSHPVTIPRFGEAESLNVSVAGAICLAEFFRRDSIQR